MTEQIPKAHGGVTDYLHIELSDLPTSVNLLGNPNDNTYTCFDSQLEEKKYPERLLLTKWLSSSNRRRYTTCMSSGLRQMPTIPTTQANTMVHVKVPFIAFRMVSDSAICYVPSWVPTLPHDSRSCIQHYVDSTLPAHWWSRHWRF